MEALNQLKVSQDSIVEEKSGINATQLKMIALITMLIDHIGAVILPYLINYAQYKQNLSLFISLEGIMVLMRLVGRVSFPIFAFLIVNGYFHTSNKAKYLLRLSLFALISEPFFDFANTGMWLEFTHQNVFFTLALGLLTIWGYDNIAKANSFNFIAGLYVIAVGLIAVNLRTDYDFYGILTIFIFYLFYHNKTRLCVMIVLLNVLLYGQSIGMWPYVSSLIHDSYGFQLTGTRNFILQIFVYLKCISQLFSLIALWPLSKYNGEKGSVKLNKYVFYLFYPVHLCLLGLILVVFKYIL